jgi:hypothetical protein
MTNNAITTNTTGSEFKEFNDNLKEGFDGMFPTSNKDRIGALEKQVNALDTVLRTVVKALVPDPTAPPVQPVSAEEPEGEPEIQADPLLELIEAMRKNASNGVVWVSRHPNTEPLAFNTHNSTVCDFDIKPYLEHFVLAWDIKPGGDFQNLHTQPRQVMTFEQALNGGFWPIEYLGPEVHRPAEFLLTGDFSDLALAKVIRQFPYLDIRKKDLKQLCMDLNEVNKQLFVGGVKGALYATWSLDYVSITLPVYLPEGITPVVTLGPGAERDAPTGEFECLQTALELILKRWW